MPLEGQRNAQAVDVADRRRQAVKMAREGESWDDIADALGYASRGAAFTDVQRAMRLGLREMFVETELYRYEQLERLREILKSLWPRRADEKVAAVLLRCLSDIADLTGIKAPVKYEIGESDVDRALRALDTELDRRARAAEGEAAPAA